MARGDQIYTFKNYLNMEGVYEHHGIDCGDGTVIHYRKGKEVIERTPIEIFSEGAPVYIKHYRVRYIPETTISRAESRLGERKYNILFNNCEHFATWCVTGVSDSIQVRDFIPTLGNVDVNQLYEPLKQAFTGIPQDQLPQLLDQALRDIEKVWNQIHPQYQQALKEKQEWEQVAKQALVKDREDLAREAIKRKLNYQKQAEELEIKLQKLGTMTQNLLRHKTEFISIGQ